MLQLDHDLACYVFKVCFLRENVVSSYNKKGQDSSQGTKKKREKKKKIIFFHVNITSDSLIDSYSHESVE